MIVFHRYRLNRLYGEWESTVERSFSLGENLVIVTKAESKERKKLAWPPQIKSSLPQPHWSLPGCPKIPIVVNMIFLRYYFPLWMFDGKSLLEKIVCLLWGVSLQDIKAWGWCHIGHKNNRGLHAHSSEIGDERGNLCSYYIQGYWDHEKAFPGGFLRFVSYSYWASTVRIFLEYFGKESDGWLPWTQVLILF